MRLMDVKRLAASYGLAIDDRIQVRLTSEGKGYTIVATSIDLSGWNLVWGSDGLWDLLPAPKAFITLGIFESDTEKADERNSEGCFTIFNHKVVNFVRNRTYDISSLKFRCI